MAALLEMKGIVKDFPGVRALKGVTVSVEKGEIHALCGENGAGKSTLMKVLSGVHPFGTYEGRIVYQGRDMRFTGIRDSEKEGIAIIAQELALVPEMSVAENIFLGRELRKFGVIRHAAQQERATSLLSRLGLDLPPETPVKHLGVGLQQMTEIGKALSKEARLLILDEPTAALTEKEAGRLLDFLVELKHQGITSILISHKLREVLKVADTVTVLRDGATVGSAPAKILTEADLVRMMVGRPLDDLFHKQPHEAGEEALRVTGLTLRDPLDDRETLVHDASLTVRKGEIVGLAGLMGAGRTELVSAVFGAHAGSVTGKVAVFGKEARIHSPADAIALGLTLVTEDRKRYGLVIEESVTFNTTLACVRRFSKGFMIRKNDEAEAAERFRKELSIKTPSVAQFVRNLSGGNQQKVVLAKWLLTGPSVLILDEPTRGIDIGAKGEIYTIIQELAKKGAAILMVSSELPELLGICDRIYVMHEGEISGELSRSEATQEKIMTLAAGLANPAKAGNKSL